MQNIRPGNFSTLRNALGRDPLPLCSLAVPVFVREQKFGVLLLETFSGPQVFTPADLPILQSVADLIALAIDRIRLELKADAVRVSKEADRLRAEVTATLSHELRLPLTAIKGYTTMLMLDEIEWTKERTVHYLQMVEDEVDSMESMIKDILDSSLIDVGQLKIEPQPVRLQYIARDVVNEIQRFTDNHHLVVDFPAEFPILEADPRWIKQVFRNILENAIKYSPDGGLIVVRGEVRKTDVVIRVADQGVGISPEDLIPLFEKYFRVRSSSTFHVSGTGLGLPVARSIVEAHGGRIWAESHLGQGTTLYFSLPKMKMEIEED
jgi:K+-sensing histidine kinase KdpD